MISSLSSFSEFHFRAFSVGAVDSDDLDVYLTPQRQKKNVRSLFGSVERGLNTVKQILTPKRTSANKPRKTWVDHFHCTSIEL